MDHCKSLLQYRATKENNIMARTGQKKVLYLHIIMDLTQQIHWQCQQELTMSKSMCYFSSTSPNRYNNASCPYK